MLRGVIDEAGLARVTEAIERTALPSILLHPRPAGEADCALGESKLGGHPDLPEGVPWPEFGGHPLAFVAQLDLAALAPCVTGKLLPAEGLLLFFIADPTPYFEGGVLRSHRPTASPSRVPLDTLVGGSVCALQAVVLRADNPGHLRSLRPRL